MTRAEGYWSSPWPAEDNGPERRQVAQLRPERTSRISTTSREALVATMVVTRQPGEVFLLCHTGGDDAVCWVERLNPTTLEVERRSSELPGGPAWPGGIAAHANGSLYVAFGNHLHRLSSDLELLASREMGRRRPYNSFVLLPGGEIVTKDFGGARPGDDPDWLSEDCEVSVLDPVSLESRGALTLPEASVARLSATGNEIYVVGVHHLFRLHWLDGVLARDHDFDVRYRTLEGQGYGWDAVITDEHVWFLDNGAGSERYAGSLVGCGVSGTVQQLVQINRSTGELRAAAVHDVPGSIVANPPAIDTKRSVAIGYDSSHGVVSAFDFSQSEISPLWSRPLRQAMHPILLSSSGLVMLNDYQIEDQRDDIVFIDVLNGDVVIRVATPSPLQSVLFASEGFENDVYVCSFSHVTRISFG